MKLFGLGKDPEEALWEFVRNNVKSAEDLQKPNIQNGLGKALQKIHKDLTWGCGSAPDGKPLLEISGDGLKHMIPVVQGLVSRAPTLLNVGVIAFRQPGGSDFAIETPFARVDGSEMKWASAGKTDGLEDLNIFVPLPPKTDGNVLAQFGFLFLDHTLGEYIVMTRVGGLEFMTADRATPDCRPFSELAEHFGLKL